MGAHSELLLQQHMARPPCAFSGVIILTSMPLIFFAWFVMSSAARLLVPALLLMTRLLWVMVRCVHLFTQILPAYKTPPCPVHPQLGQVRCATARCVRGSV